MTAPALWDRPAPPPLRLGRAELRDVSPRPVFYAADEGGCKFYRCTLPARVLDAEVKTGLSIIHHRATGVATAYVGTGTPSVFQRPVQDTVADTLEGVKASGGRVVVELDDNVHGMSYQNPLTGQFGRASLKALSRAIKAADAVTVSTVPLADSLRKWNRNIAVVPNAIDPADFPQVVRPDDGVVRVGWAGSVTHYVDLRVALPALKELAQRKDVELHMFGFDPWDQPRAGHLMERPSGWKIVNGVRYCYHGWANAVRDHYVNIANLDVALAPLNPSVFNDSKSAVKFIEGAMHGTAMVLADTRPYRDVATHGDTAFFARTPADWHKYLTLLVDNRRLREAMGARARAMVLGEHTMAHRAPLWRQALCG